MEERFDWEVDADDGKTIRLATNAGGELELTVIDRNFYPPKETRFWLTTPDATTLIIEALRNAHAVQTGEIRDDGCARIGYEDLPPARPDSGR